MKWNKKDDWSDRTMVTALIFAGGTGSRMNSKTKPKQFLELHGKAIIVYTIEYFEEHEEIDEIVVVCLEVWIEYLKDLLKRYGITKVKYIVPGGKTGQESIYKGLQKIYETSENPSKHIVLIHDGVRPLISEDLITENIQSVKTYGTAITSSSAKETIVTISDENQIVEVTNRKRSVIAKAPQSFYLDDIMSVHNKAKEDGNTSFVDSATMMQYYGKKMHSVMCGPENIKVTTPIDFYIFRAIYEARENSQIFGL